MFINFEKFEKYGYTEEMIFLLCAIKNKALDYVKEKFETHRELFESKDLIKYVKKTKASQELFELVRIDKKGEKLLKDLSSSVSVSEDVEVLGNWVINYYKKRKGGIVTNKTETLRRLQWFSDETGLVKNSLAVLIKCFINDTYSPESGLTIEQAKEENPRLQLSNEAGNIFWKPRDRFARHYNLDDSPLYAYYTDFKDIIQPLIDQHNAD